MRGEPRPRACQDCGAVFVARSGAQKLALRALGWRGGAY